MKLHFAFVMVTGISGIIVACSGTTTGTSSGGSASTSQAFLDEFCSLTAPCCGKVNKPTDGAQCRAVYGGLLGSQQYDAAKGSACLSEMRAQSGATDFCDNPTRQAPSCKGAFKQSGSGTAQPGESCSKDGDCAASAEGDVNCASTYSGNATTKACQVEIDGKAGDMPCISTRDGNTTSYSSSGISSGDAGPARPAARGYVCDLAKGIYCDATSKACTAVQDVGGACAGYDSYACVKTAYCNSQQKKCAARLAVGADCTGSSQACVAKSNCDQTTRKCVAGLPDGTACTSSSQCESDDCVNGKCAASGGSDFSTQLLCGGN